MRSAWVVLLALAAGLTAAACQGWAESPADLPTATPTWEQWLRSEASRAECEDPSHTMMYWRAKETPPYRVEFFCQPPTPNPTWQQWLGQRIAEGRCPIPGSTIKYRNERTEPPYSTDLFCVEPTPPPDVVATQVAATVAAIRPTDQPRATLLPPWNPQPTVRPTPTPWIPPPTPTMKQIADRHPETNYAWDSCWRNGGEFEIYDIRQRADGGWSWMYRCNPPPEAERRQRLEDQSDEKLLACGISATGSLILTGGLDWLSVLTCLGLLFD